MHLPHTFCVFIFIFNNILGLYGFSDNAFGIIRRTDFPSIGSVLAGPAAKALARPKAKENVSKIR